MVVIIVGEDDAVTNVGCDWFVNSVSRLDDPACVASYLDGLSGAGSDGIGSASGGCVLGDQLRDHVTETLDRCSLLRRCSLDKVAHNHVFVDERELRVAIEQRVVQG